MPTEIYFAGGSLRAKVAEDPNQVAEAFRSADGLPFRLSDQDGRGEVYINPATVAFWSALESGPEPATRQASSRVTTERGGVTDIWGNPLGKKPRR